MWGNSSIGKDSDSNGDLRQVPHQKPEVVAPGQRIVSTGGENMWYSSSGTSDSTVFVAASLALILEANPILKPTPDGGSGCLEMVKQALATSLAGSSMEHDPHMGYGVLDAEAWLKETRTISAC